MMKSMTTLLCFSVLLALNGQNQLPNKGNGEHNFPEEASQEALLFLNNYLDRTEMDLLQTLDSLQGEIWEYRPTAEAWTVKQILEHIIQADQAVFGQIKKAMETAPDAVESLKHHDAWLIAKVSDRSIKVKTPLPPPASDKPIAELRSEYLATRSAIRSYLNQPQLPLRQRYGRSPYGKADCYQLFLVLAAHGMRHHQQVLDNIRQFNKPAYNDQK